MPCSASAASWGSATTFIPCLGSRSNTTRALAAMSRGLPSSNCAARRNLARAVNGTGPTWRAIVRWTTITAFPSYEAKRKRPPRRVASKRLEPCLPGFPALAAPVAAALMLAERKVLARAPVPIVFVDDDPRFRRIVVDLLGVPADIAATGDSRGRAHAGDRQQARTECSACKGLGQ